MNELFASIKADLTDRRLLPVVVLVACALWWPRSPTRCSAARAARAPRATRAPAARRAAAATASRSPARRPRRRVAETTDGFKRTGARRLPRPVRAAARPGAGQRAPRTSAAPTPAAAPRSSCRERLRRRSGGETRERLRPKPTTVGSEDRTTKTAQPKPKTVYDVAIEFGVLPPGITPRNGAAHRLQEAASCRRRCPRPKQPLIVFRGVTAKGKSATFTLVGEAILPGTGACLPSPTQCQAVDLKPGETEQLNYLPPDGEHDDLRTAGALASNRGPRTRRARRPPRPAATPAARVGLSRAARNCCAKAGLVALPVPALLLAAGRARVRPAEGPRSARARRAAIAHRG